MSERPDDVLIVPVAASDAVVELAAMVGEASGHAVPVDSDSDSADDRDRAMWSWLGTSVAEDLCLLRRGPLEWELEGGVLCFPSRWRFADRVGRPMREVHGPVVAYDQVLADRITSLLDRLGDRVVLRRNWFVHPNPDLYQPDRPVDGDPLIAGAGVLDGLFVRSERQTLRALPQSGRIVFTIATQQCSLATFVADGDRRRRFIDYVRLAPGEQVAHRGMGADQAAEVLAALDD